MNTKGYKSEGLHHGEKQRTKRDRDGESWSATGGAAVTPGQCHGYSGGDAMKSSSAKGYKAGKGSKSY